MKRTPIIAGSLAIVPLTRGLFTQIDIEDLDLIGDCGWFADEIRSSGKFYACRTLNTIGKRRSVRMHSIIMSTTDMVDHADGDGLNNRRLNLRFCQRSNSNQANQGLAAHNTSGFKGVGRTPNGRPWFAQIHVDGDNIYLGRFDDQISAALAYDKAARRYFGEFARTNFPPICEAV
jgi:hypothetical protein